MELENQDEGNFKIYLRMCPGLFHEILVRITLRIHKEDPNFKKALRPGLKLAVTLRFLGAGDSTRGPLMYFEHLPIWCDGISCRTLSGIIDEYQPETIIALRKGAGDMFWKRWNFPSIVPMVLDHLCNKFLCSLLVLERTKRKLGNGELSEAAPVPEHDENRPHMGVYVI